MNCLANQIHSNACTDGRDIIGSEQVDDRFQRIQNVLFRDDDLRMLTADIIRHLPCIFQINGINVHADREGADGCFTLFGCNGADKRGIQSARQQKTDLCVGNKTLFNPGTQLFADVFAGSFHIVRQYLWCGRDVAVLHKKAVTIVESRRERLDMSAQPCQVLRLARKDNAALFIITIIQRTDADRITRRNKLM